MGWLSGFGDAVLRTSGRTGAAGVKHPDDAAGSMASATKAMCSTTADSRCLMPDRWEFWQGRKSRLHDRLRYRLEGGDWIRERLAP